MITHALRRLLSLLIIFSLSLSLKAQDTIITSQTLELIEGVDFDNFYFQGAVEVLGEGFFVSCEHLHVISRAEKNDAAGTKLQIGKIETMDASGNVYIEQDDKKAWAQQAQVLPDEEKMILTKDARLKDERGTVAGHRITLFKGQKEAIVEGGEEQQRPTLILHKLPKKQTDPIAVEAVESDKKSEN